ncbi:MAG: aquaporin [Armatimonadetes bacterium]|nr:aquaporin [Armatimonadota bacterium]
MAKLATEFVGTFFLIFTIMLVIASGSPSAVIAIGIVLMVMVYMGGHVSGGHYNPAVTTAVALAGKMPVRDVIGYIVAQLAGGIVASLAAYACVGKTAGVEPNPASSTAAALIVEFLFTFALALVVLNVACSAKTVGRGFYGLAIGGTVIAAAYAGGGISGGAFNPAVGLAPNLVHAMLGGGKLGHVWIYVLGPVLGAFGAAFFFKFQEQATNAENDD